MASADLIVLSSSPSLSVIATTPLSASMTATSSSPALPSPSQLFTSRVPALFSANRPIPLQTGAAAGFASASNLLRQFRSSNQSENPIGLQRPLELQELGTLPSAVNGVNPEIPKSVNGLKRPRPRSKTPSGPIEEPSVDENAQVATKGVAPEQPVSKKSRAKRNKDDGQTKMKKTRIVKPNANKTANKTKSIKPYAVDDAHRTRRSTVTTKIATECKQDRLDKSIATVGKALRVDGETLDLCLDEAVKRRRDWTPTRDSIKRPAIIEGTKTSANASEVSERNQIQAQHFGNLLSDYEYAQYSENLVFGSEADRNPNGEALTKKRKVELIHGIVCPPPQLVQTRRKKSPRKKPQTITSKATAPFALVISSAPSDLSQYFIKPPDVQIVEAPAEKEQQKKKTRPRKSKPRAAKPKKVAPPVSTLLTPELALKITQDQDLVFGTCSQLERDESPTFIKDLSKAIRASDLTQDPVQSVSSVFDSTRSSISRSNLSSFTASKNLWGVATRDFDGSLLHAEVVNLANSTECSPATSRPSSGRAFGTLDIKSASIQHGFNHIDDPCNLESESSTSLTKPPISVSDSSLSERPLPRSVVEAASRQRPKSRSRSPVKKSIAPATSKPPPLERVAVQNLDCKGYTDAELKKAIASYGLKPIKNRDRMIALVERCYEGKARLALQSLPPNANLPQQTAKATNAPPPSKLPSPPRRRGRPPKTKAPTTNNEKTLQPIEASPRKPSDRPKEEAAHQSESPPRLPTRTVVSTLPDDISESSTPPTPSPPRRSRSVPQSPKPLPLTHSAIQPPSPSLLNQITLAIKSQPPTHDPLKLSFYEQILLYDPIVLEDLTRWLNTGGLALVDVDDEVGVEVVKGWCEGSGVCCYWRENLRGGRRRGVGG